MLKAIARIQPKELRKSGVPASVVDDLDRLLSVHTPNINGSFMSCQTICLRRTLNDAFRISVDMSKPKPRAIDMVLDWTETLRPSDLARELRVSPQRLNNWMERDIPAKQIPRVAAIYNRSAEVLLGIKEDDSSLSALMEFWPKLLPETKLEVLNFAKYALTVQIKR